MPLTSLTVGALKEVEGVTAREAERAKNMFALGLMSWLYGRETESTTTFITTKFAKRPEIADANLKAFNTGYHFGETSEAFAVQYEVKPAKLPPGRYRQITGNTALSYGLIAASKLSGLDLFLGAYPITPASSILEELARHKAFGVRTFQAEDEIAAVGAALGASFGGGAWRDDVRRARRRPEVGDGRAGGDARAAARDHRRTARRAVDRNAHEARAGGSADGALRPERRVAGAGARRSDTRRVLLRRDRGGARRAHIPHACLSAVGCVPRQRHRALADPRDRRARADPASSSRRRDGGEFLPYKRDSETLARPWAIPGTPGLEHRIGGLEKQNETGNVAYDAENHDLMTQLRAQKVAGITVPDQHVDHQEGADVLVLSWGGTYGPVHAGVRRVRAIGAKVAHAHLRWLSPFPANLGDVLRSYDRVLVPEMNSGHLLQLVRARYLVDAVGYNRVTGKPFKAGEIADAIQTVGGAHGG